jgi:phage terminase small subunit
MPQTLRPLTDRRRSFVEQYLVDFNATRAAIAAGYSPASAASIGSELLAMPNVAAAIDLRQAERSAQLGLTADKVLEHLVLLAFATMADCMKPGPDGEMRVDLSSLGKAHAAAIADLRVDGEGRIKGVRFRLADRRVALFALARRMGLLEQRTSRPRPEPVAAEPAIADPLRRDASQEISGNAGARDPASAAGEGWAGEAGDRGRAPLASQGISGNRAAAEFRRVPLRSPVDAIGGAFVADTPFAAHALRPLIGRSSEEISALVRYGFLGSSTMRKCSASSTALRL